MVKPASSSPAEPTSQPQPGPLRGLIVATRMTAEAEPSPCALLRVAGITMLERQIRMLRQLGVKEIAVLASGHHPALVDETKRLEKLKVRIVLRTAAEGLTDIFPGTPDTDWLLVDGAALVDSRLPKLLTQQDGHPIAVAPPAYLPSKDTAQGTPLASRGSSVLFFGCARLSAAQVQQLGTVASDADLSKRLSGMMADGSLSPLDVTSLPSYVSSMRRDLPYYWLPVRGPEDSERGLDWLLSAAQKGTLDWPAKYIHPPIENWIVKHICPWPITPNQVTLVCNVIAYWAAVQFASGSLWGAILAALVVGVLDGVDGRLARVKQLASRLGGILEHFCDAVYEYVWQFATAYRLASEGHGTWPYMVAVFIIGVSMMEKVLLNRFEKRSGVPLDDFSPFDRGFRLVLARRNTYMWTLLVFILFDALHVGYWVLAFHALISILERIWRVSTSYLKSPRTA